MKIILILTFLLNLSFTSCQQKKFFINIQKLETKELRLYYGKNDHPPLKKDKEGNYSVNFITSDHVFTSTNFNEVKNLRDVYCFKDGSQCLTEDSQLESLGFTITVNSHFSSDTTQGVYDSFLIEKIKGR